MTRGFCCVFMLALVGCGEVSPPVTSNPKPAPPTTMQQAAPAAPGGMPKAPPADPG